MTPDSLARMGTQARRRGVRRRRPVRNNDPFGVYRTENFRTYTLTRTDRHFLPSLNWYVLVSDPLERCEFFDGDYYGDAACVVVLGAFHQVQSFRRDQPEDGRCPVDEIDYVRSKAVDPAQVIPNLWLESTWFGTVTCIIPHVGAPLHQNEVELALASSLLQVHTHNVPNVGADPHNALVQRGR